MQLFTFKTTLISKSLHLIERNILDIEFIPIGALEGRKWRRIASLFLGDFHILNLDGLIQQEATRD